MISVLLPCLGVAVSAFGAGFVIGVYRERFLVSAQVDTHPKGGDAKLAPFMGSAVGNADAPTPTNSSSSEGER